MFSLYSPEISPWFLLDITGWPGEELNFPSPGLQRTIRRLSYRKEVLSFQLLPNSPRVKHLCKSLQGNFSKLLSRPKQGKTNQKLPKQQWPSLKKKKNKQQIKLFLGTAGKVRRLTWKNYHSRPSFTPQAAMGLLNDYIYNLKFPLTWNCTLRDRLPYSSRPTPPFP